jgi:hypothetical protein
VLPTPEVAAETARVEESKMPGVHRAEIDMKAEEMKAMKESGMPKTELK